MDRVLIKLFAWFLAFSFLLSCGEPEPGPEPEPDPPTPVTPVDPEPQKDTISPTINVSVGSVNVIAGPSVSISDNELLIDEVSVASWKDDESPSCTIALTLILSAGEEKTINSWDELTEEGLLRITAADESENASTAEITLTREDSQAPTIDVLIAEKNVIAGVKVAIEGNQLLFDESVAATWTDDYAETCTVEMSLSGGGELQSGDILSEEGALVITVADEFQNNATAEITLTREDGQAPTIDVLIAKKNVIAGVIVTIKDNQLFCDESVAATWTDDYTETCTVEMSMSDGGIIKSGDTLSEAGTLEITVADEFQNKATAEIVLTVEAIYGLDYLENLSMRVDEAVNLLEGITLAEGLTLKKIEYEKDGEIALVSEPESFTLEYPCTISIILTIVKPDGTQIEIRVDGISVNPLEFNAPALETADIINEHYPWFNNLTQWYLELGYDPSVLYNKRDFVYPHVLVSYITGERYRWDNLEYIIVGEIPGIYECEDVGPNGDVWHPHADGWFFHIKSMTPFAKIKASGGCWQYVIEYINLYPNKLFMLSCASDALGGFTREDLKVIWKANYNALKQLLEKENVIVLAACFNNEAALHSTLNENEEEREYGMYKSASVNSEKNNMIAVVGFNPAADNIFGEDHQSARPIGFDNVNWNIVMPFTNLVSLNDNSNLTGSTSSMPTGTLSSTLGNHLSIIMHNHPGATLEDANTIMQERYLRAERFKYKDPEDGKIKDGEHWYFIDSDKFIQEEILHETEVKAAFDGGIQSLPSQWGLFYEGKGIQFTIDGQTYDTTEDNRTVLETAVKTGQEVSWSYNADRARKYGVAGENTITVRVMDRQARLVPDVSVTVHVE